MRGSSTEFVWLALKTRSAHTFIDSCASMRVTKPISMDETHSLRLYSKRSVY